MLPPVELYQALSVANTKNLFAELQQIYDSLPETTCNNCAACCSWGSPPAFFIEYLNMYQYVKAQKNRQRDYLINSAEYFYLELVDINQKCPFIGADNKCEIYPVRPITCRVYGLLNEADFNQGDQTKGLKFIAKKLWEEYQIKVPDEIANGSLSWCGSVKNSTGKYLKKDYLAGLMAAVSQLDANFFPADLVEQEGTMLPYPTHLMNTVLGKGSRARKIKIMKEFADHGTKEQLAPIIEKVADYQF